MRELKIAYISLFSSVAGVALWSHATGQLWPAVSLGALFVTVVTGTAVVRSQPSYQVVCLSVVLSSVLGLFLRVWQVQFGASLPGMDPDKNAVNILRVVNTGGYDVLNMGFYETAAAFHVLGASSHLVTGTAPRYAILFIPVLVSIATPLLAATFALRLPLSSADCLRTAALAPPLASVGAVSIVYGYTPIAQAVAVIICFTLLVVISRTSEKNLNGRDYGVGVLCLIALVFTHKLSLVVLLIAISGHAILHLLDQNGKRPSPRGISIYVLVPVAAALQYLFITDYGRVVVYKILSLASGLSIIPTAPVPVAAVVAFPGISGLLWRRIYLIGFVLSALPAAWVLWRSLKIHNNSGVSILGWYGSVSAFALFAVLGPSVLPVRRLVFHVEALALVLVAAGIVLVARRAPTSARRTVVAIVIAVIVVTQVAATPFVTDHPEAPRYYLESEEVTAKNFASEHTDGFATDFYAAREITPRYLNRPAAASPSRPLVWALLNRTHRDINQPLLYREVDVYRMSNGDWRLQYDLERDLAQTRGRVYTNGQAALYRPSQHQHSG